MKKSILLGGILGGVVAFIWGAVSWMALPIHEPTLLKFKDEAAVTSAIAANAPVPGVYMLPNGHSDTANLTPEQRKAREAAAMKQWETGPSAFVAVRLGGIASMTPHLLTGLITNIVGGLLIAWLVSRTTGLGYWGKVGFIVVTALAVGILAHVPEWNWWGFSAGYTATAIFDHVAGWFLGGLVIAKLAD